MNKTFLCAFLCVLLASATATRKMNDPVPGTNVDQATNALQQLVVDAQNNLEDLQNNWARNQPILQAAIDSLNGQVESKQEECNGLVATQNGHQAELDNANNYVAWLNNRIVQNQDKISQLLADRCTQSNNYIDSLKNDQIALALVEFLIQQVQSKTSFDFAQRKTFSNRLLAFMQVYHRGDVKELLELQKQVAADYQVDVDQSEQGRTAEQIGDDHVDNNLGDLEETKYHSGERQTWETMQADFLAILSNLQATINQKIANGQNDQVASGVAAASLKRQLEHEIQVYERELVQWNATVLSLQATVANDQQNVNNCNNQLANLNSQLSQAQDDLREATEQFNHKQSNFQEEVQVFQEVLQLYVDSTGSQGSDFKNRADDYLDDQNFQNGGYNAREVDGIPLIN